MPNSFAPPAARISEDAGVHLGRFLLVCLTDLTADDIQAVFDSETAREDPCVLRAAETCETFLSHLEQDPDTVATLRDLGAAFSVARNLDHPPPDGMAQAYWNRLLRDQAERLRAAALTLSAGQAEVATSQLSRVRAFLRDHLRDLPV